MKPANLNDVVRQNLKRLRESTGKGGKNQDIWGDALGIGRSGYSKKESGDVGITLSDIDAILDHFDWITISQLFAGHPAATIDRGRGTLGKDAQTMFPYLLEIVMVANSIAEDADSDDSDLRYLMHGLERATSKISAMLGEAHGSEAASNG